jgi:NADH:ubiquinone oxidoreductase subunit F (NADH-binding)
MTSTTVGADPRLASRAVPRLLPDTASRTLDAHVERYGLLPRNVDGLVESVERSGLAGRGGAGFPAGVKMRAVADQRRAAVVVGNGTEGEPASAKDKTLLTLNPHLVLDGAVASAVALGAREVIICVDRSAVVAGESVLSAIAERGRRRVDAVPIRLERAPSRYVAGEESALVSWLNGGDARPQSVPPRPFEKGVAGKPTLVQNVETLAHIGLIARFGPEWFRALGSAENPGTALITCSGAFRRSGVYEVPFGIALSKLFGATRTDMDAAQAVLIGGYFGTWFTADELPSIVLDGPSLRARGSSFGCGVVAALGTDRCGLAESAHITRWLAGENAGQCGPCVNGLEAIANAMTELVRGDRTRGAETHLRRWLEMVKGRGACKHPDGAARFVESSLRVFSAEIERHRRSGPCRAAGFAAAFPLPKPGAWR